MKRHATFLGALFFISLLIRGLVFTTYLSKDDNYWQIDSPHYHEVAKELAEGKGVSNADGSPHFYRLPGYPYFLSFWYQIFGSQKSTALWAQVVLASCIPILIFLLSLTLFPGSIIGAKAGSLYSAMHIGLVLYAGFFMTESLFILLFLWFSLLFMGSVHLWWCEPLKVKGRKKSATFEEAYVYGFCPEPACEGQPFIEFTMNMKVKAGQPPFDAHIWRIFFSGIVLGLASLVRPVGQYVIVLAAVLVVLSNASLVEKIRRSIVLVGAWLIVVVPWLLRNFVLTGHIFFHTLPGEHFLYLSAARVAMQVDGIDYKQAKQRLTHEARDRIKQEEKRIGRSLKEIERSRSMTKLARTYFIAHPFISCKVWLTDMLRASLSLYSSEIRFLESGREKVDYFAKERTIWSLFYRYLNPAGVAWWVRVLIWGEIILFFLLLLGFFFGLSMVLFRWVPVVSCRWLICLPYMGLFIVLALAGGYARMRLPVEPFLIILSASFWSAMAIAKRT